MQKTLSGKKVKDVVIADMLKGVAKQKLARALVIGIDANGELHAWGSADVSVHFKDMARFKKNVEAGDYS